MIVSTEPLTRPHSDKSAPRALLSLRETALLAGVSEAKVRKDIETGVLSPIKVDRLLLFRWADVFLFAAIYRNDLSSSLRRTAFEKFEALLAPNCRREFYRLLDFDALAAAKCEFGRPSRMFASCDRMKLDHYLFIDFENLIHDLAPKIDLYAEGLTQIEEREGVLGGEAVFKGTRLAVRHVGKMHHDGEPIEKITDDYPYLNANDVKFAELFFQAHPTLGRPPASPGIDRARDIAP